MDAAGGGEDNGGEDVAGTADTATEETGHTESAEEHGEATPRPDRTRLYQFIGGALALVAITAVVSVTLTRSSLQAPEPDTRGRIRGTSFDSFNRSDGATLGTTETGRPWQVISGEWTVQDGSVVAKPEAGPGGGAGSALAVLDAGVADQYVQATFFDPSAGSGLVTRFKGANNFIGVTFAPVTGTVQLGVTVDGTQAQPSKIGSVLAEGEVTLGVRTEGTTVVVYVNGAESGRQVVPELGDGTRVGVLIRGGDAPEARVDDVLAVPLSTKKVGALGGLGAGAEDEGEGDAGAEDGAGEGGTDTTQAVETTQQGAPTPGAVEPTGAP